MDDGSLIPRPGPSPCDRCPKGSPANDSLYRLSYKNLKALHLHRRIKSGVMKLPPHLEDCPVLADNFAIIDETIADAKQSASNREVASLIALNLIRSR